MCLSFKFFPNTNMATPKQFESLSESPKEKGPEILVERSAMDEALDDVRKNAEKNHEDKVVEITDRAKEERSNVRQAARDKRLALIRKHGNEWGIVA